MDEKEFVARLKAMRDAKPEIYGDEDDSLVLALREIAEKFEIPRDAEVVYPGSATHVGVARVFGAEHVVHVDPDSSDAGIAEVMVDAGYRFAEVSIEDFTPDKPADVMVAWNSYGEPTTEIINRIMKPGGMIITNNWTHWAARLSELPNVSLEAAILPAIGTDDAQLFVGDEVPADAAGTTTQYIKFTEGGLLEAGTAEDYDEAFESALYTDAAFVFTVSEN